MSSVYSVLLALICVSLSSGQMLQPRKLLSKVLDLHEKSRNVLSGGDSMKLNVDLSSAKDFPVRDDLRLRVFNKDNNVTVCDTKLFDHVEAGQFPCSFDEAAAQLKHGANNFELEVYSNVNWKIYNTQKIPNIHYFDNSAFEGFYDSFVPTNDANATDVYMKKTVLTGIFSALLATIVIRGPVSVTGDIQSFLSDHIGTRMITFYSTLSALSSTGFKSTLSSIIYLASSSSNGMSSILSGLKFSLIFLYDIFSAGLASPYSMILSGSSALFLGISTTFVQVLTVLLNFGGDSFTVYKKYFQAFKIASKNGFVNFSSVISVLSTLFIYYGKGFLMGLGNSPKSILLVVIATGQFLFDIFSAGLSSPAGMIVSGNFYFPSIIYNINPALLMWVINNIIKSL